MEKTVFFVRHGESLANIGVPTPDYHSIPLTEKWRNQAMAVRKYFSRKPDLIVHSPYIRTLETATPLIQNFPGIRVEQWAIQEFTYLDTNISAGTTYEERRERRENYWNKSDPKYVDGPGAESFSEMLTRVKECKKDIESYMANEIVVFCHGQIMQALGLLARLPDAGDMLIMKEFIEERKQKYVPKNTEIWKTRITDHGKWLPFRTKFPPEE